MTSPKFVFCAIAMLAAVVAVFSHWWPDPSGSEQADAWQSVAPEPGVALDEEIDAPGEPGATSEKAWPDEPGRDSDWSEPPGRTAEREAMLDASELLEQQTRALGYFAYDERAVYASYSLDQLESLLEQGDLRAYPTILDQYAAHADEEYLAWVSFRGAIHGSGPAIRMLAHLESSRAQQQASVENQAESKEYLLLAQALFKAATELGDPFTGGTAAHQLEHQGYVLTEQDLRQIDSLSQRFLETLDRRRREQGFEPLERASDELKAKYQRLDMAPSPWGK